MTFITMRLVPALLLAAALASIPLVTACVGCPDRTATTYAEDRAAATLPAGSAVMVPLTISAPMTNPDGAAQIVIEITTTDCAAGSYTLGTRMLRADGTALSVLNDSGATETTGQIVCPNGGVRFVVPLATTSCTADGTCHESLQVELTSTTGVGPREIEARLIGGGDGCNRFRGDVTIDAWGM